MLLELQFESNRVLDCCVLCKRVNLPLADTAVKGKVVARRLVFITRGISLRGYCEATRLPAITPAPGPSYLIERSPLAFFVTKHDVTDRDGEPDLGSWSFYWILDFCSLWTWTRRALNIG